MDIISELQKFGFSKVEAEVYMEVLNTPMSNGTQISKKIDISRSAIYTALEKLCEKGYVYTVPTEEDKKNYMAMEPMEIIAELKEEWKNKAEFLEKEFLKIRNKKNETRFYQLYSEESLILKVKEIINKAENEIYIGTNIDIHLFEEELLKAIKASIKIFIFNFGDTILDFNKKINENKEINKINEDKNIFENYKFENYNMYNLKIYNIQNKIYKNGKNKEIIIVSDIVKGFSCKETGKEFIGVYTENKYLVKILTENIHNNIYTAKMERVYGEEIFEEIFINSAFEKEKENSQ
jgi:sugar-specific transcriptional regulator trmB superfamily